MAFKMKGSSYKMGGVKTKDTMAYMKSPLEQGSTSFIDKVKAAGGALYDNVGKVHGHGTSDSFSSNVAKSYGKKKKEYRKEAADSSKKKSPLEQAKLDYIDIDKDGNTTESMKEASMAKMKSPMQERGVYKTVLDEESGKEKVVQTTTDDPEASIYTGADANKSDTADGYTPSAKLVKDRKKHLQSLYQTNEQAHSSELDANIQRKLDNNQPLTAVEKKAKANATRRLNMERN